MKPERAFVAERAAAVHCVELLGKAAAAPGDLLPALSALGERFAKALAPVLARFTGGEAPRIKAGVAGSSDSATVAGDIGALAANSLFVAGTDDLPVVISLHAGAVLGMVDRTFGGRGLSPDPLPVRLPLSAELMMARLEGLTSVCLSEALGLPTLTRSVSCAVTAASLCSKPFRTAHRLPLSASMCARSAAKPGRYLLSWPKRRSRPCSVKMPALRPNGCAGVPIRAPSHSPRYR